MNFEDYRFNQLGDGDLTALLAGNTVVPVTLGKDPETSYADDGREVEAVYLGFRRCGDDSYLLYAYRHKDREFGFLWETFFDETERAKSGGEPHVWYDDVEPGHCFRVRFSMKDHRQHVALDEPFTGMNDGQVVFLGERGPDEKEGNP